MCNKIIQKSYNYFLKFSYFDFPKKMISSTISKIEKKPQEPTE
jgi:hypothetical protein